MRRAITLALVAVSLVIGGAHVGISHSEVANATVEVAAPTQRCADDIPQPHGLACSPSDTARVNAPTTPLVGLPMVSLVGATAPAEPLTPSATRTTPDPPSLIDLSISRT